MDGYLTLIFRRLLVFGAFLSFASVVVDAKADFLLQDLSSSASVSTLAGGISGWTIDNASFYENQALFYSVGGGSAQQWNYVSSNTFNNNQFAVVNYTGSGSYSGLGLTEFYTLVGSGSGSGSSTISEQFQLTNSSTASMAFQFYQYNDLGLGLSDLQFPLASHVEQIGSQATAEIALAPSPTYFGAASDSSLFLPAFESNPHGSMNNPSPSQTFYGYAPASAMEWDVTLAPNQSYTTGEQYSLNTLQNNNVVPTPEPATISLLAILAVGLAVKRVSRRKSSNG